MLLCDRIGLKPNFDFSDEELEIVGGFSYLASSILPDIISNFVSSRIQKTRLVFTDLRYLQSRCYIFSSIKGSYVATVRSVLLYG